MLSATPDQAACLQPSTGPAPPPSFAVNPMAPDATELRIDGTPRATARIYPWYPHIDSDRNA